MTSPTPLQGTDLIGCAKANAKSGLAVASQQCGYGKETDLFKEKLQQACEEMGFELENFRDLITDKQKALRNRGGVKIAPDSRSNL